MADELEERRGAGGTRGGVGEFLLVLGMAVAGAYRLTQRVTVTSGYWALWGYNAFGLSLLPLLFGVVANLGVYFQPTSLFNTLVMLVLLAGGIGLVARSLRAHG